MILESEDYQIQKGIINREVNTLHAPRGYALPRLANPGRIHQTDFSAFKKSKEEKLQLSVLKAQFRSEMREKFPGWKRKDPVKPQHITVYSRIIL